jgi:YlmC/YmxH family sporulation protein
VIDLHSGQRLGYIYDAEIDPVEGRILSLMIPGPGRAGGLLGRDDDYVLPWNQISRMGRRHHPRRPGKRSAPRKREKRQIFY